jgi:hypothetical protein
MRAESFVIRALAPPYPRLINECNGKTASRCLYTGATGSNLRDLSLTIPKPQPKEFIMAKKRAKKKAAKKKK